MKLRTTLLSATLSLVSLALTPSLVLALSPLEIRQEAEVVTVRISHPNSPNQGGSGVIIERNGNEYTVLTNCHVIEVPVPNNFVEKRIAPEQFRLFPGGSNRSQGYEFEVVSNCEFFIPTPDSAQGYWKTDLAVLRFTSNENLPVAELSENLRRSETVYVAGYPLTYNTNKTPQGSLHFTQGNITQIYPSQGARRGYEVVHNADTRNGMSGGPIFNGNGELIAISGKAEESTITRGLDFHGIPLRVYQEWRRNRSLNPNDSTNYSEEGRRFLAANNYSGAIEAYNQAIVLNPNNGSSYLSRGLAYDELGETRRAIRDYNEALRIYPNYALAYYSRGLAYDKLQEYQRAIHDYNELIRLDPNYAPAYYSRGLTYHKLQEYKEAIRDYSEALRIDPNYTVAYNNRGLAYDKLQDYEKAIRDYSEALRIAPNYTVAYNNRGLTYYKLGEYQKAIRDYNEALRIDPNYANAYFNRGNSHFKLGEIQRAIEDYRRASELYRQQGNREWYQRALDNIRRLQ